MARQIPGRIKDNFADYHRFIKEVKTTEHASIRMSKGAGQKKNYIGKSAVIYAPVQGDKAFEAEISIEDRSHYRFRLFAFWFDLGPCLRFDSKGRCHCNPENGKGLKLRQVHTPHFHRFDQNEKVEIAYTTPRLRGVHGDQIVRNYSLGFEYFCQEAKLKTGGDAHPVLEIEQAEFDLSNEDPQNGVSF